MILLSEVGQSTAIFAGVFTAAYFAMKTYYNDRQKRLPCLPSLPIVGSFPFLSSSPELHKFFMEKSKSLGDVFALYMASDYTIVLNGKQAIHDALVKKSLDFADRPFLMYHALFNPQAQGIIDAHYDEAFKKYHQLSLSILRSFGLGKGVMENRISVEVEELVRKLSKADGQPVEPSSLIQRCVVNVISGIIFGGRYDLDDSELDETLCCIERFFQQVIEIMPISFFPLLRFLPSFKSKQRLIHSYHGDIMKFIEERITESRTVSSSEDSFIKCFIDAEGPNYDHEELQFILRDLLIAGTDTSSTTLRWALLLIANNPDVQRRLHDEIDSVVPRHQLPSLDDRPRLPYVEATILEIWRKSSFIPLSVPRSTLVETEINGCTIPAGTAVFVNLYSVHMDPDVWPNPSEFRPDRFLDKDGHVINKDAIIPFSIGRRSCLGELLARQEVFLFLTGLLQQFVIRPLEGFESVEFTSISSVLVSPSQYEVRFIPRHELSTTTSS